MLKMTGWVCSIDVRVVHYSFRFRSLPLDNLYPSNAEQLAKSEKRVLARANRLFARVDERSRRQDDRGPRLTRSLPRFLFALAQKPAFRLPD